MTAPTAQDRYAVGQRLFQAGNYELAEKTLREALVIEPTHYLCHALLALSLHYLGRSKEALAAADAALAIHPTVDALCARALAKLALGDPKGAIAAANDAVALMPASAGAVYTLACTLEKSKALKAAEIQYKRCADLAPGNMVFSAEYGRFLIRRGRLNDAEAVVAEIAPHVELVSVLLLRGEIALWRGHVSEARELALWVLSGNAQNRHAITLLTLATANRNPLLKLWWRHVQILRFRAAWQRIAWMGVFLAAGMALSGLPILLIIYVRIAQRYVTAQVRAELKQVRLSQRF